MSTMNVSLPEALRSYVEEQVAARGYGTSSEFIRDLIRRDRERAEKHAEMQRLISEGLASGVSERTPTELLAAARAAARSDAV